MRKCIKITRSKSYHAYVILDIDNFIAYEKNSTCHRDNL